MKKGQKQQEILEFIKQFILDKGYPPTVRDIGIGVDLKSTASVHFHLEQLEKNGLIESFYMDTGPEGNAKKRTYYRITDNGRDFYRERCDEWILTKEVVEKFIRED